VSNSTPGLRDRIALLIRRNALHGVSPEATATVIVGLFEQEAAARCRDRDCARLLPHSRLSAHLWKHAAEAPFDRVLFAWLCFTCGLRRGHRIHRGRRKEKP
jgi:hypothetical protein